MSVHAMMAVVVAPRLIAATTVPATIPAAIPAAIPATKVRISVSASHNVNLACETLAGQSEQEEPSEGGDGEKNVEMSTNTYSAMGPAQSFFGLEFFHAFRGLASSKWGFLSEGKYIVAGG